MRLRARLMIFGTLLSCIATHYALIQRPSTAVSQVKAISQVLSTVQLTTEAEVCRVVSHAAAAKHAIMFVHVDWAFMEAQRTQFTEFALRYQAVHPNDDMQFHYVDITPSHSHAALRSIPGWMQLENSGKFPGQSLIHGRGEVVWLTAGQALHVESIKNFETTDALVKFTEKMMPQNANR